MLTLPIPPAWPTQLLNTHLGASACGPRLWLWRHNKRLEKRRLDFVARPGLSSLSSHALSQTTSTGAVPVYHHLRRRGRGSSFCPLGGPNWRSRRCSCMLNPLDQERRALVLECHESGDLDHSALIPSDFVWCLSGYPLERKNATGMSGVVLQCVGTLAPGFHKERLGVI